MKKVLKTIVVAILARQVIKLRKKHNFKIIGVVGGIGKTSTKLAIAQTLGKSLRVKYQEGNYNDIVSVPLIFFGHAVPSLHNPFAWLKIFISNSKQIKKDYPYDVVVVELGTDAPGQIAAFSKYLQLDIAVITALVPEHMVNFADLQAVVDEELAVINFADKIIYNADYVNESYRSLITKVNQSYSLRDTSASYYLANLFHSSGGYEGDIKSGGEIFAHFSHEVVSETQLYSLLAAVIVSIDLGLKSPQVLSGLSSIKPVSGRLRRLKGMNSSTIIDDTYNSSPEAVKAGLELLFNLEATQKIAILGNMNELGETSAQSHKEIGDMCEPSKLDMVVTIGPDASQYLAAAASAKGCQVKSFDNPYEAGEYVQSKVIPGAMIFAKGSQNNVFAEEAVKLLLADPEDVSKLVRQSDHWLQIKRKNFKRK